MKKVVFALAGILCIFIATALLVWHNLPHLGSYVIGKMMGGKVEISAVEISRRDGMITARLADVGLKGKVRGTIKSLELSLNLRKGLYFDSVVLSGFDLVVPETTERGGYSIPPTARLEVKNGTLTSEGRTFVIKECVLSNPGVGKPFHYRIDVTNNALFGNLQAVGEGFFRGKMNDLKGHLRVTRVDMGSWYPGKMDGHVAGEGSFSYEKGRISFDGSFEVFNYNLTIDYLKSPVTAPILKGKVDISHGNDITNFKVTDLLFKGASFRVNIRLEKAEFAAIALSSGFMAIRDVEDYVDPSLIGAGSGEVLDDIQDGMVKIDRLAYEYGRSFNMDLQLKEVRAEYKDVAFSDISGSFHMDDKKIEIAGARGAFRESSFHDFTALIPVSGGRMSAKGAYSINVKDVPPSLLASDNLLLRDGVTSGTVSLQGGRDRGYSVSGNGFLQEVDATWKNIPLSLSGSYSFTNDGITFDPMRIRGNGTDVTLKGTWTRTDVDVHAKGGVDVALAQSIQPLPIKAGGTVQVDGRIDHRPGSLNLDGTLEMNDASFEVPGIVKKEKGIKSSLTLNARKDDQGFHIKRLSYNLDIINLDIDGTVREYIITDLNVYAKVGGFEKVAKLFFMDDDGARGDAEAKMTFKHLDLRSRKIPRMEGYITINNGSLKVPWVTKTFKEVSLKADFKGDSFDVSIDRFTCGNSILSKGALHMKNLESPHFSVALNFDALTLSDFQDEFDFKVRPLDRDTLLSRASGDISLRARKVKQAQFTGEDLEIKGVLADRKLNISEFKVDTLGGKADIYGTADFSGSTPLFYANGKVTGIKAAEALKVFDAKTEIIDSTGMAYGSISATGENPGEWFRNVNGTITLFSQDGVIKKWNLLSKIFSLLNFYDLLRGQTDLSKDGLSYKKMGAAFHAKNGVLRTDNFSIDSSAMFIAGAGEIDLRKREIDGQITVSPLVAIDTVIDKVPIVRSILGGRKKGGFLHAAYEVKGPLDNPEINVRFVDTIGGKAINILRNIVTLPNEVLQ
jgi:hypothetical protein